MVDGDEELLGDLRRALRSSAPDWVHGAGRAAYSWHTVDAELADLSYDSAADPAGALARARADPAALRALTFVASGVTIEVEVTAAGVQGHVVPAAPGEVELHLPDGSRYATALDDVGWFLFARRPDGRFRLQLRLAGGGTALTPWTATP